MKTITTRKVEIEKPTCVVEYNAKMQSLEVLREHLLSIVTLNSYYIYKKIVEN